MCSYRSGSRPASRINAGTVGAIGLSNSTLDRLRATLPAGIVCVQNAYSVLSRDGESQLDLCRAHGIAWVPFFPLGSAFPGLPKVPDRPEVQQVAREVGATPAQVGLVWLLGHGPNVLRIPGTGSLEHLEQNVDAADVHLDADQTALLDGLAAAPR